MTDAMAAAMSLFVLVALAVGLQLTGDADVVEAAADDATTETVEETGVTQGSEPEATTAEAGQDTEASDPEASDLAPIVDAEQEASPNTDIPTTTSPTPDPATPSTRAVEDDSGTSDAAAQPGIEDFDDDRNTFLNAGKPDSIWVTGDGVALEVPADSSQTVVGVDDEGAVYVRNQINQILKQNESEPLIEPATSAVLPRIGDVDKIFFIQEDSSAEFELRFLDIKIENSENQPVPLSLDIEGEPNLLPAGDDFALIDADPDDVQNARVRVLPGEGESVVPIQEWTIEDSRVENVLAVGNVGDEYSALTSEGGELRWITSAGEHTPIQRTGDNVVAATDRGPEEDGFLVIYNDGDNYLVSITPPDNDG